MNIKALNEIRNEILQTGRAVKIVAVTKYVDVEETNIIARSGADAIGENRVENAKEKFPHLTTNIEKHFIGAIQSNKISDIVELFDVVESVGSIKHLTLIDEKAKELNKKIRVFLQFNISEELQKSGFAKSDLSELAGAVKGLEKVKVIGVMGMASRSEDTDVIRSQFRVLGEYRDGLKSKCPTITELSIGMSDDYLVALEEGSTILRLGRVLL